MGAVGIVLTGGRSSRMGTAKAALEWHGSTLLARTVHILLRVTPTVVVVRAPDQPLPDLPAGTRVLDDPEEGIGPMQGLAVGLAATEDEAEHAFVCSTDLPFLHPVFASHVLDRFTDDVDTVVPHARGHRQPLAAGYRTALAPTVARLLAAGSRKPAMILDACRTLWIDEPSLLADPRLAAVDPDLDSVRNINRPEDYEAARSAPPPVVTIQRYGTLARDGGHGSEHVAAATLGQAAETAGVVLDRHVVAALNGERISRDPHLPLVRGDTVAFLSADAGG
jgi:molybdenum cofactor guanylyltransferase